MDKKETGHEGMGFTKGYSACAQGEDATPGDSGNVSHLMAGDGMAAGTELLKGGWWGRHQILECRWFLVFQKIAYQLLP